MTSPLWPAPMTMASKRERSGNIALVSPVAPTSSTRADDEHASALGVAPDAVAYA